MRKSRAHLQDEIPFMKELLLALGSQPWCRCWRQNVGSVVRRDDRGRVLGMFHAGPPNGVADISGFVRPEGWRLEVEVKADGGRRRKEQIAFSGVAGAGGVVYVIVEFDESADMATNVAAGVLLVELAISDRRRRAA